MGTRALVRVFDESGVNFCTIYLQTDGYPDGWMLDVAEFLATRRLVNGYHPEEDTQVVNGMKDLAAQVVAFLKIRLADIRKRGDIVAGTVYIVPPNTKNVGEEWVYNIKYDSSEEIIIEVFEVGMGRRPVWRGTPAEYVEKYGLKVYV